MACLIMIPFFLLLIVVGIVQAGIDGIGGPKGLITAILIAVIWAIWYALSSKTEEKPITSEKVLDEKDDLESRTTEVRDE